MSTMRYFEVLDDVTRPNRWFVAEPRPQGSRTSIRGTDFIRGEPMDVEGSLAAAVRVHGEALDFTFADFGVPVVRADIAQAIERVAPGDVQRIPVFISGQTESYEVLNVVGLVDCLDEERSKVTYWTDADGIPELVGTYLSVIDPVIDPMRTENRAVFRMNGWFVPLIVNEPVARLLATSTGVTFKLIQGTQYS